MQQTHIIGWGSYLPERVLTNDELAQIIDTSSDWIYQRTGIRQRHIAAESETAATLAIEAARQALIVAALEPIELDLIIVASITPEYSVPTTACQVQHALGAKRAAAFDLNASCSGFNYGLTLAAQAIATGFVRNVLVIGAETLSRIADWQDRGSCILFGDGAGAVILQGSDMPGGMMTSTLGADGSGGELIKLSVPYPNSVPTHAFNPERPEFERNTVSLNGREVFRFATRIIVDTIRDLLDQANLSLDDIDLIIPHQANARIIESAARNLNISPERFFMNIDRVGNTASASIPLALCEAAQAGRLQPHDRVIFIGFGGGLTWAATLVEWSSPLLILPQMQETMQPTSWPVPTNYEVALV